MAASFGVDMISSAEKILLKLPNFNSDLGEPGESIQFNTSHASDEIKRDWNLTIYPKGNTEDNKDHLSVFLLISYQNPIRVQCRVSLIDKMGAEKRTASLDRIFAHNSGYGWPKFIPRNVLFDQEKGLLDNGNLTFAVEIQFEKASKFFSEPSALQSSLKLQQIYRSKFFTDVTIKVDGGSIEAHKALLAENSLPLYSIMLLHKNQSILELDGLDFEVAQEMINFIYEERVDNMKKNVKALLKVARVYEMERLKKYCEKYLYENLTPENALATLKLTKKHAEDHDKELLKECIDFIGRNIKSIIKENWEDFVVSSPSSFNDILKHCVKKIKNKLAIAYETCVFDDAKADPDLLASPEASLNQDYETLFADMLFADVELVTLAGKVLKAHKVILSSRSTVFRAMFQHDTLEAAQNEVIITDFDYETVQELLRFIYCEKVQNLKEVALSLLPAADKYNLLKLKKICEESVEAHMTVENVTKILELADLHNCLELKGKSVAFIGRNIMKVISTSQWDKFVKSKPMLVNSIFITWIERYF